MKTWKIVCWSISRNYNVYVEAENVEQAKRLASDCIDNYNNTVDDIFDDVYYRKNPELVLVLPEGTKLNELIHVKRKISDETFEDWLNS